MHVSDERLYSLLAGQVGGDLLERSQCELGVSRKSIPFKHAAPYKPGLRVVRIGPEVCTCEHRNFVDDRMYFSLSIAKMRLDNSRLRLHISEAHDLTRRLGIFKS